MKKALIYLTILLTLAGTLLVPASSILAAPLGEGIDSYVKALLHFNGADASTSFLDEIDKTWTASGNAQIDTAQAVFGVASGLFDGTSDKITAADSLDWQLDDGSNSNSWTIDFRLRFNGDPGTGNAGIVQQRADNNGFWYLALQNNKLHFGMRAAGIDFLSIENTWDPGGSTWYHVAIVKQGTTGYKFFIDGSQIGTTQTDTDPIGNIAGGISIGSVTTNNGTYELNGWLDELRISKGVPRWTSNFTPPTDQYQLEVSNPCQLSTPITTNDNNQVISYSGSWSHETAQAGYIENDRHISSTANSEALLSFFGSDIVVVSKMGPDGGKATVYIDNVADATIDLYAADDTLQSAVYCKTQLSAGIHTIKVRVAGTKNSSSTGYGVNIDAFRYQLPITAPPQANEIECRGDDPGFVCTQVDTQHITIVATNADSFHGHAKWRLTAGGVGTVYSKLEGVHHSWKINIYGGSGHFDYHFDTKGEWCGATSCNYDDQVVTNVGPFYFGQQGEFAVQEFVGEEVVATLGDYFTTAIGIPVGGSGVPFDYNVESFVLNLSTIPFGDQCIDQYLALTTDGPYVINPAIEFPQGPTGSPADEQTYSTVPGHEYIVSIGGDPWHDGTAADRMDAAYSWNNVDWYDLQSTPSCHSETEGYWAFTAIVTVPPGADKIYLRANDEADAFADNYMDGTEKFLYKISLAILIGQNDCSSQFSYDPETDWVASTPVPATSAYVQATDQLVPGDWYVIEVASGSWQDDGAGPARYDAQFSFGEPGTGVPTGMNLWHNIADGGTGVYCAITEGNYTTIFTQADNSAFLYYRVNDQNLTFTPNTGQLGINLYHATFSRTPSTCELTYSVDWLLGHSVIPAAAENGITIGVTVPGAQQRSGTITMEPGAWYMIETTDGPWGWLGATHSDLSYDMQIMWGGSWTPLESWAGATCNVAIDALGHRRVFFQAPAVTGIEGGAAYTFRVADTEVWFNNVGSMGIDMYAAVDLQNQPPNGSCDYIYDVENPIQEAGWIVGGTDADGVNIYAAGVLVPDTLYAIVIDGNHAWQEQSGGADLYALQISTDNGQSWNDLPNGWGQTLCYIQNGNQTTIFFKYGLGTQILFRVDSQTFENNTGAGLVYIYPANAGDSIDPWTQCAPTMIQPPIIAHEWIDIRKPEGNLINITDAYKNDAKVIGFVIQTEGETGPWWDGNPPATNNPRYDIQLSSDGGMSWHLPDKDFADIECAKWDFVKQSVSVYFKWQYSDAIQQQQIWRIRVNDEDPDPNDADNYVFTDNTGALGFKVYAVTDSGFPDCLVNTNDANCIDWNSEDDGIFDWGPGPGGTGFQICSTAMIRPVPPSGIDVPAWLDWLGQWINYANGVIQQYFAWCPRHTDAIRGSMNAFATKDPLATITEVEQVVNEVRTDVAAYNWSDTNAEPSGLFTGTGAPPLLAPGGGQSSETTAQNTDSIMARLFPGMRNGTGPLAPASGPWNGGPLITGLQTWTPSSHFNSCVANYSEFVANDGLTNGICFIDNAAYLAGLSFILQLILDIAVAVFLVQDLIGVWKGTAAFMAGGAMQGAQYGE